MLLGLIDMCIKHIPSPVDAAKTKVCIHYIIMCPFSFVMCPFYFVVCPFVID